MHINKPDDSKCKKSSERSAGACPGRWACAGLRAPAHPRSAAAPPAHCLSSSAHTCCGQPVRPLVFLSLLLTVLFKISFWAEGRRGREKRRQKLRERPGPRPPPTSQDRRRERARKGQEGRGFKSEPLREAAKSCAALAGSPGLRARHAQLPGRPVYQQLPVPGSLTEAPRAFSLPPDVGARAGVGAKSGSPDFDRELAQARAAGQTRGSLRPGVDPRPRLPASGLAAPLPQGPEIPGHSRGRSAQRRKSPGLKKENSTIGIIFQALRDKALL